MYVYCLRFVDYYYIGSTVRDPMVRFSQHRRSCFSNRPMNPKLAYVWKKHGEPKLEVLFRLSTEDEMFEYEQHLIDQNFGNERFLNLSSIVGRPSGMNGKKHSSEAKAKSSASNKIAQANPIIAVNPNGVEFHYSSARECTKQTGFDTSRIGRLIRSGKIGKWGKVKGWSFRKS